MMKDVTTTINTERITANTISLSLRRTESGPIVTVMTIDNVKQLIKNLQSAITSNNQCDSLVLLTNEQVEYYNFTGIL